VRSSVLLAVDGDAASCISAWPTGPSLDPVRAWLGRAPNDSSARNIGANPGWRLVSREKLMNEVVDLSLHGFSHQNVLFGLTIETAENGFRLNMDESYGISGTVDAKQISIRLTPGKHR